jgi:hypothetical protein
LSQQQFFCGKSTPFLEHVKQVDHKFAI